MARIVITVPDDVDLETTWEYVRQVAEQIDGGFTSGHVDAEHHWAVEGRLPVEPRPERPERPEPERPPSLMAQFMDSYIAGGPLPEPEDW